MCSQPQSYALSLGSFPVVEQAAGPQPQLLAPQGPSSSLVAGRSDRSGWDAKPASSGQSPPVQGLLTLPSSYPLNQ